MTQPYTDKNGLFLLSARNKIYVQMEATLYFTREQTLYIPTDDNPASLLPGLENRLVDTSCLTVEAKEVLSEHVVKEGESNSALRSFIHVSPRAGKKLISHIVLCCLCEMFCVLQRSEPTGNSGQNKREETSDGAVARPVRVGRPCSTSREWCGVPGVASRGVEV